MAAALEQTLRDAAILRTAHQLVPELAPDLADRPVAIFVDAEAGYPPGQLQWGPLEFPVSFEAQSVFTHRFSPADLLWFASLFGNVPRAFCVSVTANAFELRDGLTPAVAAAVPGACQVILEILSLFGAAAEKSQPPFPAEVV